MAAACDEPAAAAERSGLESALARLSPRQRTAVVLRYHQALPDAEIAELLGWPVGAVRSHASRGTARLRQLLAEGHEPVHTPLVRHRVQQSEPVAGPEGVSGERAGAHASPPAPRRRS